MEARKHGSTLLHILNMALKVEKGKKLVVIDLKQGFARVCRQTS
jgi:hypothetical protein